MTKICSKCGSVYELSEHKIIFRDRDSLDCDVCGATYMKWNGAVMFSGKLIKRGSCKPASEKTDSRIS